MQNFILHTTDLNSIDWSEQYFFNLNADHVHVYLIEIDDEHVFYEVLKAILNKDELERLNRFKKSDDQVRFVYAHGALRLLCEKYLQQPAHSIVFTEALNKKPCIEICFGNLFFNLSHSGNKIVIAFSTQSEVGVDIEQIRPDFPIVDFMERNYSINEFNSIKQAPNDEQFHLFFKYWSRKEAWLKAIGTGIFSNLKGIDTALVKNQIIAEQFIVGNFKDNFYCHSFIIEDYRSSIVINDNADQLSFYSFNFNKLLL